MGQEARGFTLIELLTTLAVLAIMLTIGVPAFTALLERSRAATSQHLITASLMSARASAVARRHAVILCPSSDGKQCRADSTWEDGWIMFSDPDGDRVPTTSAALLRRTDALGGGIRVRSTDGRRKIRYRPDGRAHGSNVTIRICSADARLLGAVVVNNTGRARSERAVDPTPCPFPL